MAASRRFQATDLALIAVFAALIAVLAIIPPLFAIGAVPFAIQMIAVMLAPLVLGGVRGGSANALYLIVGALGLPVFAGQSSGPGVLFGPTGGYIWGFVLGGFVSGAVATQMLSRRPRKAMLPVHLYLVAIVDLLVIYLCGVLGLVGFAKMGFGAALAANGPLLLIDLIKALIAVAIAVAVLTAFPRLLPAARTANDVPAGTTTQSNASTSQVRDNSDSAGTAAPRHAAQTDTTGGRPGEDPSATVAGTATEPMTK